MKKAFFFISLISPAIFFLFGSNVCAADIKAQSAIVSVTVYPDSAMVTRTADVKFEAGQSKVLFEDIIPDIDENSLRVSAAEQNDLKILGAEVKKVHLAESGQEKIKQIVDEIQKMQDQAKVLNDTKAVLDDQKKYLDSVRLFAGKQLPEDLVTKMPSAKELTDTLEFLGAQLTANKQKNAELDIQIREIAKKIEVLQRQLNEISGDNRKMKRSVIVEVFSAKPLQTKISVAYLVRGANWNPIYDARADFAAGKVELAFFAIVRQKTGEDWDNVDIAVSTAKPSVQGRLPYVAPWFVRPAQPYAAKRKARLLEVDKEMMVQGAAFDMGAPQEALALPETVVASKGIAVVYNLSRKATIKSDGQDNKLNVTAQTLKADFKYSSYPRSTPAAYLGSRVANAKDLQLLGGRMNVFLDGDFVGASSIDNVAPGEAFDLYLGADESVKIKREEIEKKVDETIFGGIASPNRVTTLRYKLTVENYKSRPIGFYLFEAMPVPQDDRIKIKVAGVSQEPKVKDWKDRKGVWKWELTLKSGEKQEIFYTISVEHPRAMDIDGLFNEEYQDVMPAQQYEAYYM